MPRTKAQILYHSHLAKYRLGDFAQAAKELRQMDPEAFRLLRTALQNEEGEALLRGPTTTPTQENQ